MYRVVEPELLDVLSPTDPEAIKSRVELRLVNRILGHKGIFVRALRRHLCSSDSRPLRFVEIGAGDGTFALRLARELSAFGVTAEITLLDVKDLVSRETCRAFADCGWVAQSEICDVFQWLSLRSQAADVMITNLFLHHFTESELRLLLTLTAAKANLFIACEPRRSLVGLAGARMLGLLHCNAVTRCDGVTSVRAGFAGGELSKLWPAEDDKWRLDERPAGLFSHSFLAKRN